MAKQSVKMKNIILQSSQRDIGSLNVDGREIKLSDHGTFVSDSGLAKELEARHSVGRAGELSKDIVVCPVPVVTETHHNYFFAMPEMPWKKKKEKQDEKV